MQQNDPLSFRKFFTKAAPALSKPSGSSNDSSASRYAARRQRRITAPSSRSRAPSSSSNPSTQPSDAGKVEPLAPTLPIADVQEREPAEVRGRAEPVAAIEKLRAADREQLFRAEASDVESGGGSVAVANAKIDVLAREVDVLQGRADPEIDLA